MTIGQAMIYAINLPDIGELPMFGDGDDIDLYRQREKERCENWMNGVLAECNLPAIKE